MIMDLKEYIKDNPHILTKADNAYITKHTFLWGTVNSATELNFENVYEVYNLVNNTFFNKQPMPFENISSSIDSHYMFREIKSAFSEHISLAAMFDELGADVTIFWADYPNQYGMKNKLIIICDKADVDALATPQDKEVFLAMNAYTNLVLRKCKKYVLPPADAPFPVPEAYLHWVWYRKTGAKFSITQFERALSWITLNPELESIYLWTDMDDESELDEFLADVPRDKLEQFKARVTVKYRHSVLEFLESYFQKHAQDKAIRLFDREKFTSIIRDRDNSGIMIAKTDYLRAMILHDMGGFYADFNDCQCVMPIKYWMAELYKDQEILWPGDVLNPEQISNYFLYVPKCSKRFERIHYITLEGFQGLWKVMKNEDTRIKIAKLYIDMAKKYLKKLKLNPTDQPLKLLTEIVMPTYSRGSFLCEIEDIISKVVLNSLELCDARGRVFLPMYCIDFIGKKTGNSVCKDLYKYMSAEMAQVATIQLKQNFNITKDGKLNQTKEPERGDLYNIIYFKKGYFEDYDDIEKVVNECDTILAELDKLYDDTDFQAFFYKKFILNMNIAIVSLTNIMLHKDMQLNATDIVPFSFAFLSFCYMTMVVHWGEGTSVQL